MPFAPLAGLILSGGHSRRMQRDKATLDFNGESLLTRAARLLERHVSTTYVSVRPDQIKDPQRMGWPLIVDQLTDVGPAAGILAALTAHPAHAWLVVAIDLPMLDEDTLVSLISRRNPERLATAYLSAVDGLPEPLCTIWEPASRQPLETFIKIGKNCPRKFLLNHATELLDLKMSQALANVNTPDDFAAALQSTQGITK
jgi:molybdopterin-guanine dinucleotide biosynthesis protein A